MELRVEETAQLQRERTAALEELERQDTANQNLRHQNQEQQLGHKELRRELDTKSEMVGDAVFAVIKLSVNRVEHFALTHNCDILCKEYFFISDNFLKKHHLTKPIFKVKIKSKLTFFEVLVHPKM